MCLAVQSLRPDPTTAGQQVPRCPDIPAWSLSEPPRAGSGPHARPSRRETPASWVSVKGRRSSGLTVRGTYRSVDPKPVRRREDVSSDPHRQKWGGSFPPWMETASSLPIRLRLPQPQPRLGTRVHSLRKPPAWPQAAPRPGAEFLEACHLELRLSWAFGAFAFEGPFTHKMLTRLITYIYECIAMKTN